MAGVLVAMGDVEQRANRQAGAVLEYQAALRLLHDSGPDGVRFDSALVARYAAAVKAAGLKAESFRGK